jgi:hypothetical protein
MEGFHPKIRRTGMSGRGFAFIMIEDHARSSDRLIEKADVLLTLLERLATSEKHNFTPSSIDVNTLKKQIKQRSQDPELLESVASALKMLAEEIIKGLLKDKRVLRVRLTKMINKAMVQKNTTISMVGWEIYRPRVGKPYRIFMEDGGLLITSTVTKVLSGYIQTKNSVYEIEVVRED